MKKRLKILLFCLSCLTLVSWDRATKDLAKTHLKGQEQQSYLQDTFRLVYTENTGAAMSFGDDLPKNVAFWLLGILPLAFLVFLIGYTIRKAKDLSFLNVMAFSMIIAGGLGNIIDRLLFDRHVTDFMNIGYKNIRTGIFNFADVWICIGAIGLMILCSKKNPAAAH
jgi:signal peptidase II